MDRVDYGTAPRPGSKSHTVSVYLDGKLLEKREYFFGEGGYYLPRFSYSQRNVRDRVVEHKQGMAIETFTADVILKPSKGSDSKLPNGELFIAETQSCKIVTLFVP